MIKLKDILSESKVELGKVYPNPYVTAFKPESQIKEEENSVNEMQVVNKKTGKDITKHVLALLSGKIDKKKFEKLTGLKKEASFRPNSGTKSGGTHGLDNRKYELKRDVKGVKIGDYTNITLPKGTIIYNIPGGVFAHHRSLRSYESGQNKYFNKPTFRGISVRREKNTILSIEKNSKILESINEEADDHEVGMGLSSLKSSVRSAKVIYDNIKKRNIEELDGWVQEKLTLASDYLKNVADYMEDLDEYDKDGTNN